MKSKLYILLILVSFICIGVMVVNPSVNPTVISTVNTNNIDTTTNDEFTKILYFGDNYSSYSLEFNGKKIKLIYTFQKYDPIIYHGDFVDGEIIVDGCDYCYKFENTACDGCQSRWELCVYKGETDSYDCYSYDDSISNSVVMDLY